jgi:hypothetical protein
VGGTRDKARDKGLGLVGGARAQVVLVGGGSGVSRKKAVRRAKTATQVVLVGGTSDKGLALVGGTSDKASDKGGWQ